MPSFPRRSAFGLALSVFTALASIGPVAAADLKTVNIALDWTPNTNHVGLFVAEQKGYFRDAGLDVKILPYTDTAAGTLVSNHVADFGIAGIGFYSQRAAGADLKGVYAVVQKETGRLIVDAKRTDIQSPKNLDGLTYGGFGSAWENALITDIIKHDGGKGDIKTVTLGTSAYEALANGSVDFTLEVATWEGVEAELRGAKLKEFTYSDYGVPDEYTTFIVSSDGYLKANGDTAKGFLAAVQKGYAFAADHPEEAGDILIAANPDTLTNHALVTQSMKALVSGHYLRSADGVIGNMDLAKIDAFGQYLVKAKILVDGDGKVLTSAPDFSTFVTNDYLPKK
ncbi:MULTISPECIES: ABC transporter substrate-binding protein [unclassified Rhizobium]|uniref:ABC transporter substrate-binding protein n=1 Tax=unclassified Rhizobium TaxID=2613769 RepID=UPI00116016A5|nr:MULTISPECIES: ABC transporter substrate-binding protein [unclassified Rhizobium]TQX84858.1 ABC transporter substrate-binding protein [Rhizobium sp. rho-13.1]TQY08908.1 ABC transporter substrate-binding protein [Rhizobium sp. rho-1.1]